MNLDASRFRIHNVSAFPYVVFDGLAMTPSYASEWAKEMDALVEFGKPFVVVYERMHAGEDHEDRKLRGKWLKLNEHALSLCCKAVISIEPDEARREEIRVIAATAVKAFGIPHEVVATPEEAQAIVECIVAH
ncbi:MAG: hypothetical protein CBARDMAM_2853 [uncultured Caballeronia sp.]|nr:MAG: hypothetical protein CBARDMAM_2853 [uncultured Caballeronia sp.]